MPRAQPKTPSVLSDLRTGWLADNASNTARKPAKRGAQLDEKLEIIAGEFARLLAALGRIPSSLGGALRRSFGGIGERAVAAAFGAPGLVFLFGIAIVGGALLYSVTVQHVFGRSGLSGPTRNNSPWASAPATPSPKTANAETQSTGDAGIKTLGNGRSNALIDRSVAHFGWFAEKSPAPVLPPSNAVAKAVDLYNRKSRQYEPAEPAYGLGKVFDLADSGSTSKAKSKQPQRVEPALQSSGRTDAMPVEAVEPRIANAGNRALFASPGNSVAPPSEAFPADQRRQLTETRGGEPIASPGTIPDSSVAALEQAQVAAAGGHGDVEATAREVIAHGGGAVFEVRHFDAAAGVSHPARIVVTSTAFAFLPEGQCAMGALMMPLTAIRSVQFGEIKPDQLSTDLLNIEVSGQTHGDSPRQLSLGNFLANVAGGPTPGESALLTHIRRVILATQGRL